MYTETVPTKPGLYNHRWIDPRGQMKEQVLFVGWVTTRKPLWQGAKKPKYGFEMKCCKPDERLHADRLTPKQWGGFWEPLSA